MTQREQSIKQLKKAASMLTECAYEEGFKGSANVLNDLAETATDESLAAAGRLVYLLLLIINESDDVVETLIPVKGQLEALYDRLDF